MTKLPTVSIKGKNYVAVSERLKYFRQNHAGYSLETEVVEITEEFAIVRAVIRDDKDHLIATGLAREVRTDSASFVNKTSYVENCETSAWGRALANFGIGIDDTVASADELVNAINTPEPKAAPKAAAPATQKATPEQIAEIKSLSEDTQTDYFKLEQKYKADLGDWSQANALSAIASLKKKLEDQLRASEKAGQ